MIRNILKSNRILRVAPRYQLQSPFFSLKKPFEKIKEFVTPRQKSQTEIELEKTVDTVTKGIGGVGGFILGRVIKGLAKSVAKDMEGLNEELQKIPQVISRTVSIDDEIKAIVGEFPIVEDLNQTKLAMVNDKIQFETTCVINGHNRTVQAIVSGIRIDGDGDYAVKNIQIYDSDGSVIITKSYEEDDDDDDQSRRHKVRVINVKATSVD